jgi:DNA-binding MarR family transcriptional regulator
VSPDLPVFRSRFAESGASPGFLLWKASNLHQRLERQALRRLALSPAQFSVLACYFFLRKGRAEPVSQSDVCAHAALDKMYVSDATRELVRKKLIGKRRSKTDRRAFSIVITARGARSCNEALCLVEAIDATFFARTGDVQAFVLMMNRLLG